MIRHSALNNFFATHSKVVQISVDQVRGSAPRNSGTEMFVSSTACLGTIGGGQLEFRAIAAARSLFDNPQSETDLTIPLGPEIGQCCGGYVTLTLQQMDHLKTVQSLQKATQKEQALPHIYIFGAGHVGRALAAALLALPVSICLIDSRQAELDQAEAAIPQKVTPVPEADIRQAPPSSAFVILTHDHALDFQLAAEALSRPDAAYVGMIGSKTKRNTFENWIKRQQDSLDTTALICPIGGTTLRNKRPEVIAAFVTTELLTTLHVG
ncbi:MAG: xanthine dehydrogenase accessory protein XdhC [Paracoccaceae bacterium]|nr:xanthine dehydrogenase accessory protein XdhC [Paracoccaceae bacterium]